MHRAVALSTLAYAGIGAAAFAAPEQIPAVFGGSADGPDARTEIRAVYGGLPMAIAASALASPAGARTGAALSLGMALGRAAGIKAEGEASPATWFFLGVETVLAVGLLAGARGAQVAVP